MYLYSSVGICTTVGSSSWWCTSSHSWAVPSSQIGGVWSAWLTGHLSIIIVLCSTPVYIQTWLIKLLLALYMQHCWIFILKYPEILAYVFSKVFYYSFVTSIFILTSAIHTLNSSLEIPLRFYKNLLVNYL